MNAAAMLTANVGHGHAVAGCGNASASAARASVPSAPPAKIAAISRRSTLGSTRRARGSCTPTTPSASGSAQCIRYAHSMMKAAADASERFLLVLVLVVAAVGVAVPSPGRALAAGNGIDTALAVLVFATGLSLRLADLAAVRLAWRRIAVVLLVSTAALPVLAWAASQLIGDPVLRSGMQTVGVAPAEVATVALCVIAGGDAAVCATLLAASTLITVVAAGPILSLLGASVIVSPAGLLGHLA